MLGVNLIIEQHIDQKVFHTVALHPKYHSSHFWSGITQRNAAVLGDIHLEPYSITYGVQPLGGVYFIVRHPKTCVMVLSSSTLSYLNTLLYMIN